MQSKLKIGFLLDDTLDTPDGVQQYVLTLGEWFTGQGHEVHYLVGETKRTDIHNIHSLAKNVKVSFNQNKLSIPLPANKAQIKKLLRELSLDVLHVQVPYSPFFAGRVINSVSPSTKVVGTFHIVPATRLEHIGARSLRLLVGTSLKRFDAMISVSSAAQSFAKQVFNIDSVIIPNAVSVAKFKRKPSLTKPLHIVFLGRLVERKGCEYLLRALTELNTRSNVPAYSVTIAGKGALMDSLKMYVQKNNLDNISFIGFIDESDKPTLLSTADIAVFPSTGGESFGIVLIEAMAAGARVVLGGNNIGYKTVLGSYPDVLVDPKNTITFADALERYLRDEQERNKAYSWAQETIRIYDVDTVGNLIKKLYLA